MPLPLAVIGQKMPPVLGRSYQIVSLSVSFAHKYKLNAYMTYASHLGYIIQLSCSLCMFTGAVTFNPVGGSLVERSEFSLSLTPHFTEGGSSLSVEVRCISLVYTCTCS